MLVVGSGGAEISDSAFRGNAAATAGGALHLEVPQPLQLCDANAVVSTPSGDIAASAPGAPLPTDAPVNCSYVIGSQLAPGCLAEFRLALPPRDPFFHSLRVLDRASGAVLFVGSTPDGAIAPIPPPIRATGPEGLLVRFSTTYANTNGNQKTGFAGSYSAICPSNATSGGGGGGDDGGATTVSSDTVPLHLRNATFTGNTANTASGGAVCARAPQSFDGRRAVAADLQGVAVSGNTAPQGSGGGVFLSGQASLVSPGGLALTGNAAGGGAAGAGGGGLAMTAAANVTVTGAVVAGNSAAGGSGGGLLVNGLSIAESVVRLTDSSLTNNTALLVRVETSCVESQRPALMRGR